MKAILFIIFLGGCASQASVTISSLPADLLKECGSRTMPPPVPKPTADRLTLAKYSVQLQLVREATDKTLAECSRKHADLVAWLKNPERR